MPLPKPPVKRAALLTPADFESQAAPKPGKRNPKNAAAEPVGLAVMDLLEPSREAAPLTPRVTPPPAPLVVRPTRPQPQRRKPRGTGPAKLFVLDTNVLMHDPMSLFRFEEHDIYLPMITLEELDDHKRASASLISDGYGFSTRDTAAARARTNALGSIGLETCA